MRIIIFTILLFAFCINNFAQYEDTGNRGSYFSKKNYSPLIIPAFKTSKDKLPSPILDDNKEYIELYWKAWELAFKHFKKPPQGSPFVSDFIDEAFSHSVFQWDTIFMIMFARYAHFIFPSIQSLDNFYCRQYENGYICREIQEEDGQDYVYEGREHTVNPPLFSWAELENVKVSGDFSRIKLVLPVLEKYAEWLEKFRKKENTKHNLYWQTGLGSGMDNTPRGGSAWTDMSCQMVILYNDMAVMSDELDLKDKAEYFRMMAKNICSKINELMWNQEDGLYYDLDDNGNQVKCKTIACFWPLIAGIANEQQAEKLFYHLKDTKSFWRTIPFPSLSADHPSYKPDGQYWLGSVWAPTNIMVIKGLQKYDLFGFNEFATFATETYLDGMFKVYKKSGTIWENYSPDTYARGIWSKPDFVGWSGCGPIQLLIENVIGINADGLNNQVTWNVHRIDRHGIERLRFGKNTASFLCNKRTDLNKPIELTIESDNPFELTVVRRFGEKKMLNVIKGKNNFIIE